MLSYIGVGIDPSMGSWGNMINGARSELSRDSTMRSVPQLKFVHDTSLAEGTRISALIDKAMSGSQSTGEQDDG